MASGWAEVQLKVCKLAVKYNVMMGKRRVGLAYVELVAQHT